ncbi:MAG: DUF5659 domain-containing protein [Acidobacteriota bacterium]
MKTKGESPTPPEIPSLKTSEIGLAAFLRSRGCTLVGTEEHDGRVFWIFQHLAIEDFRLSYLNDGAVPAQTFLTNMRTLRGMARGGRP